MKLCSLFLFALCSFSIQLQALTDKGKEAAKQLEDAMRQEAALEKPKTGEENHSGQNIKVSIMPRMRELLANPDSPQFLESISQISAYFTSEPVLKSLGVLQKELRDEREANEKATMATIKDALAGAEKAVREAKVTADLDETISTLGKFRRRYGSGQRSEELNAAYNQVEPTLQFVTNWQNYLSAKIGGNLQSANDALRNLMNNNGPYLIPRSEILALVRDVSKIERAPDQSSPQEAIDQIIAGIKSLADVDDGIRKLRKLQEGNRSNNSSWEPLNNLMQSLLLIDKTYQDFKAGLAVNIEIYSRHSNVTGQGNALVSSLQSELYLLLLPRYVGAPQGTKARPDENVPRFMERIGKEAKERGDIIVASRTHEALRILQRGSSFSNTDMEGLRTFVAGQNQEVAGQWMLAVISYQTSLKSGSDLVPSKVIGERLAALRSAYPKEFETGMERFLNPPAPAFNPGDPRFLNRNMRDNLNQPGQANQPSLLIPPAPVSSPSVTTPPAAPPTPKE